jgi:hypothetical protein
LKNQSADLFRNSVSATHSHSRFAEDGPIQPESSAVPAGTCKENREPAAIQLEAIASRPARRGGLKWRSALDHCCRPSGHKWLPS